MTRARHFRITPLLAGILLCGLMLIFATAIKVAGYHPDAPARSIATMKLWQPNPAAAVVPPHLKSPSPAVVCLTPDAQPPVSATKTVQPAIAAAPASAAWFAASLRLRPPPIRYSV